MLIGAGGSRRVQREIEVLQKVLILLGFGGIRRIGSGGGGDDAGGGTRCRCAGDGRQRADALIEKRRRREVVGETGEPIDRVDGRVSGVDGSVPVRVVILLRTAVEIRFAERSYRSCTHRGRSRGLPVLLQLHLLLHLGTLLNVIGEFRRRHPANGDNN